MPDPRGTKLRRELGTLTRFGVVGLAATAVHLVVAFGLMRVPGVAVISANAVAFVCAFGVSFLGHYHVTFGAPGKQGRAFRRFLATGLGNFMMNNGVLALLLKASWVGPRASIVLAIAVIPLATFLVARCWAFAREPQP